MLRTSLSLTCLFVLWFAMSGQPLRAGELVLDAGQMKAALRTTTLEENGFIDYVVDLTERGKLPANMVHSTFLWARKKPAHKYQYFRKGLLLRAKAAGIKL